MIGIIVTGHLKFASGYQSALEAIVGKSEQLEFVDFNSGMSSVDLEQQLRAAVQRVDSGEGVLFLTDIAGGSPFQCASKVALESPQNDVLSGTNLGMAAELCLGRFGMDMRELVSWGVECGTESIKSMRLQTSTVTSKESTEGV